MKPMQNVKPSVPVWQCLQVLDANGQNTSENPANQVVGINVPNTTLQGDAREIVVNNYFMRNGFTPLEGKCGTNCFDGVFVKGDKVYIVETKPLGADGTIKLSPEDGLLPPQMTNAWIESRAKALIDINKLDLKATGETILQAFKPDSKIELVRVIAGADSKGVTLVKLK